MRDWPTRRDASYRPPSLRRPRRPLRRAPPLLPQVRLLLLIVAFLAVCYYLLMWAWERTAPREVRVPEIVSLAEQEAVKLLESCGLRAEVVAEKASEEAPAGTIIQAEPPADRRVKAGRIVRLTLSTGSRWSVLPDVREMSVERARALLREARLTAGRERADYHPKVPVGYVIGQAPAPGEKLPRGSSVDLLVSKGPKPEIQVAGEAPPAEGVRTTQIDFTVPPGASLQEVRIVVVDRGGARTAYLGNHRPGETISHKVSGQGGNILIKVYLSGQLVQERRI